LDDKETNVTAAREYFLRERLTRSEIRTVLGSENGATDPESDTLNQILRRPDVTLDKILRVSRLKAHTVVQKIMADRDAARRLEIEVKYEGYLKRQDEQIALFKKNESLIIPDDFDYAAVKSLSNEGREKLAKIRPRSIGQAMRISGVSPADATILMIGIMR
jgi:tRNA uridine 5-carboxymethylaminomethyl modification enzyme